MPVSQERSACWPTRHPAGPTAEPTLEPTPQPTPQPTPSPTCSDNLQNGDEIGPDCGGSCLPCLPPALWRISVDEVHTAGGCLDLTGLFYTGAEGCTGAYTPTQTWVSNTSASFAGTGARAFLSSTPSSEEWWRGTPVSGKIWIYANITSSNPVHCIRIKQRNDTEGSCFIGAQETASEARMPFVSAGVCHMTTESPGFDPLGGGGAWRREGPGAGNPWSLDAAVAPVRPHWLRLRRCVEFWTRPGVLKHVLPQYIHF